MIGLLFGVHKCCECGRVVWPWQKIGVRLTGVQRVTFHSDCEWRLRLAPSDRALVDRFLGQAPR